MQLTPPGSPGSVIFVTGVSGASPGSVQGLMLIVDDIDATRNELVGRGVDVSAVFHDEGARKTTPPVKGLADSRPDLEG